MESWKKLNESAKPPLDVLLRYGPLGLIHARTEGVAADHILVDTGPITLNHQAEVEILMSIPEQEHVSLHRIAALVSHSEEGGKSLLQFNCCGPKTREALVPYLS